MAEVCWDNLGGTYRGADAKKGFFGASRESIMCMREWDGEEVVQEIAAIRKNARLSSKNNPFRNLSREPRGLRRLVPVFRRSLSAVSTVPLIKLVTRL